MDLPVQHISYKWIIQSWSFMSGFFLLNVVLSSYIHVGDHSCRVVLPHLHLLASPSSFPSWRSPSAHGPWAVWFYNGVLDSLIVPFQYPEPQINILYLASLGQVILADYIWLIYCLITRDLLRGENSPPIFAWNVPLVSVIFLKRSLVFTILLFFYISLRCSLRKAFLSLLALLWNSAFKWVYFSFSPLPLASLLPLFQSFLLCPCTHLTP